VNADGTELTQFAIPDLGGAAITALAVDQDGSRAFFQTGAAYTSQFYKVEVTSGLVSKIYDAAEDPNTRQCDGIQTAAGGEYLYCLDAGGYNGDVWRMAHGGGGLTKVIEDRDASSTIIRLASQLRPWPY